uniref:Uncharacterized protein n=1 Tax=Romanomermis culicivorax TaxID=13658 RepID=A0A915IPD1_ROMCU
MFHKLATCDEQTLKPVNKKNRLEICISIKMEAHSMRLYDLKKYPPTHERELFRPFDEFCSIMTKDLFDKEQF